jgi:hypothetical protein
MRVFPLLRLYASFFHHARPLFGLLRDKSREFGGLHAAHLGAFELEALARLGRIEIP